MIINKIELYNIGPYTKKTEFDLNTYEHQNVVLIGGKNGSGKTTLLNSIKYGLFGSLALGYKTNNSTYFNEISKLLNLHSSNKHHIIIEMEMIEKYQKNKYTITRKWTSGKNIQESNEIWLNDIEKLEDNRIIEFYNKVKHLNNNAVINSFVFDGEQIAKVIENNEIENYIRGLTESLFNINLLKQTNYDIKNFLKKLSLSGNNKSSEHLISLISDLDSIKLQEKALQNSINQKSKIRDRLAEKSNEILKEISMIGGATKKVSNSIDQKLKELLNRKEEDKKYLKNYLENIFPLYLIKGLLDQAKDKISKNTPKRLLQELHEIQKYVDQDLSESMKQIKKLINDENSFYNIDHKEENDFFDRYDGLEQKIGNAKKIIKSDKYSNKEFNLLKKIIDTNEHSIVKEKLIESNELNNELYEINLQLEQLRHEMQFIQTTKNIKYIEYENVLKEINKSKNKDNSFVLATKLLDMLELYQDSIIESKLKLVSDLTTKTFAAIHTKGKYASSVDILSDFSVSIKDINENQINLESLSAGEKQLLLASIVYSMYKISKRNNIFIFDTPLARLDKNNRKEFIEIIIKNISKQVIILSTDSEFTDKNLDLIQDNISKKYLISYDEMSQSSNLKEGYFGEKS